MKQQKRKASEKKQLRADDAAFERAMEYMRKNFRTATLNDIAAAAGFSPFHFHRVFSKWSGRTPKSVLTEMQLDHARSLMLKGKMELAQVADECGFAHQSHFTQRFHLMTGQTPGRWIRSQRQAAAAA